MPTLDPTINTTPGSRPSPALRSGASVGVKHSIINRSALIAVFGLGYVGLPVSLAFTERGFTVFGIEPNRERAARIKAGDCPIPNEPDLPDMLRRARDGDKLITPDNGYIPPADIFIVCVPTPLAENGGPDTTALRAALADIALNLTPDSLVIIESTIAPKTMRDVVIPALEKSTLHYPDDFTVAHAPERLTPGKLFHNLLTLPRIVGADDPLGKELAALLYSQLGCQVRTTSLLQAEITKTAENAYRDVEIAFANELALMCERLGADVWQVRELINTCPGRNVLLPGPGVGGHCLPKDGLLLLSAACSPLASWVISGARYVNDGMPVRVASDTHEWLVEAGVRVDQARVLVLGYAYREDTDDSRGSPSREVIRTLRDFGYQHITVYDPCIDPFPPGISGQDFDAVVVMVNHSEFRAMDWRQLRRRCRGTRPLLYDTRGLLRGHEPPGFYYKLLGRG